MASSALQLTGTVHVADDVDTLVDDLAMILMARAIRRAQDRGVFHLALSGGSTPEPFYMRLVTDPRFRLMPWPKMHVWLVDERRVPETDDASNVKMIRETLTDHVPIGEGQVHSMSATRDDAVDAYERELRQVMLEGAGKAADTLGGVPRLDFVLLGMGDDAHTASLFPHSPALAERDALIALNDGPQVTPPPRVTMTFPLLNAAHHVVLLVTGAKKAATLQRVALASRRGESPADELPVTGVNPQWGSVQWFLDSEAADVQTQNTP